MPDLAGDALAWPGFGEVHTLVAAHVTLTAVLFGVVLPDYLLTCAVAMLERQPRLLLLGVFFPFLRMLDACYRPVRHPGRVAVPVQRPVEEPGPARGRTPRRGRAAARRRLPRRARPRPRRRGPTVPAGAGWRTGRAGAGARARDPATRHGKCRRGRATSELPGTGGGGESCIWVRTPAATVHSELMDPVRILLVDDHLMVTEALASRLSAAMDLWVAGRCTTADPNLLEIVRGLRPDVITIEVEPLGAAVGEVLSGLVAARPEARVVVLSADHDIAHGVEAARAGVSAWVAKEQGAAELETVIRGVCQGYSWFPPDMLGAILASCAPTSAGPVSTRTCWTCSARGSGMSCSA